MEDPRPNGFSQGGPSSSRNGGSHIGASVIEKALAVGLTILAFIPATLKAQIIVEYSAPPSDLAAYVMEVAVVARVKVVESTTIPPAPPMAGSSLTRYHVRVLEAFKGDKITPGSVLTVVRTGTPSHSEAGFRYFDNSEELILFLEWWPAYSAYTPAFGPDGAFGVDTTIKAFGHSRIALAQHGRPVGDFVSAIRAAANFKR